jgi:hypothetical protein
VAKGKEDSPCPIMEMMYYELDLASPVRVTSHPHRDAGGSLENRHV